MKYRVAVARLSALLVVLMLGGCQLFSSTHVEKVTSRKPLEATMSKVLVVGVDATPQVQKAMEEALSRRLAGKGRVVVRAGEPPRIAIARVQAEGVTGVLVTRLLDYEGGAVKSFYPSLYLTTPRDYWERREAQRLQGDAARMKRKAEVGMETSLRDVSSGQVRWQARVRTQITNEDEPNFDDFAATIVRELRKSGWL